MAPFESRLHRAVRKMVERKMTVTPFVTHDGKMVYSVNGYILTPEHVLELHSKGELTNWGITEFALKYEEKVKSQKN